MTNLVTYEQCRRWLDSHIDFEKITAGSSQVKMPTLERISQLCKYLGDPQECAPSFHIAGTNGKGSTARIISELIIKMNLTVGTFTSPDLGGIHERICYELEPIKEEELSEIFSLLANMEPLMAQAPTRFELLCAAGFTYFANCGVDVQVIEVGLGGKWDSTNIIAGTSCIITNIGLDHTEILGDTKEEIALQKAGIVKPGSLVTIVEPDEKIASVLLGEAERLKAGKVFCLNRDFSVEKITMAVGGWVVDFKTPYSEFKDVFLSLLGEHQINNAIGAVVAVEAFFDKGISEDLMKDCLSTVSVPGRLEIVGNDPLVVLDGAHNVEGVKVLNEALNKELAFPKSVNLIIGILANKNAYGMLSQLQLGHRIKNVIVVEPNSPRRLDAYQLLDMCEDIFKGANCVVEKNYVKALDYGRSKDDPEMVLITGSLYVVGDMRSIV